MKAGFGRKCLWDRSEVVVIVLCIALCNTDLRQRFWSACALEAGPVKANQKRSRSQLDLSDIVVPSRPLERELAKILFWPKCTLQPMPAFSDRE